MRRPWIAILSLCLAIQAGCSPRGAITLKPEAAQVGTVHRILVGTTRSAGLPGGADVFSAARSEALSFARFDVSVPAEPRARNRQLPHQPAPGPAPPIS